MRRGKPREEITLLDILIDGFEKNEVLDGFHWRVLPMPDEAAAVRKFNDFAQEARRRKGPPTRELDTAARRFAAWPDLDIRQAGHGILIRVWSAWFRDWWHERATWKGEPLDAVYAWIDEETRDDR